MQTGHSSRAQLRDRPEQELTTGGAYGFVNVHAQLENMVHLRAGKTDCPLTKRSQT
ncbi:hypothetical protein RESH_02704 [Rhodopirellula europaea SH398]|uniref:Uncharacterized protein n=1 Tax=Rhodopirellula europaea SH398 TaxID=1263868 RepID=M5S5U6_9BACT|nr:hypothetical protein RESH_02704 [Rhodopirellula europaea SH398]